MSYLERLHTWRTAPLPSFSFEFAHSTASQAQSSLPPPKPAKMIQIETPEQFNERVAEGKTTVACFSAPWCGGCKTVAPHVQKLSEELDSVQWIKVSAADLEEFCDDIEVEGFPSFRVYKEGKLVDEYCGSKPEKVEEFIRAKLQ